MLFRPEQKISCFRPDLLHLTVLKSASSPLPEMAQCGLIRFHQNLKLRLSAGENHGIYLVRTAVGGEIISLCKAVWVKRAGTGRAISSAVRRSKESFLLRFVLLYTASISTS